MTVQLHNITQNTPEWFALRKGLYTGSNASKLLKAVGQAKIAGGILTQYAQAEVSTWRGNATTRRAHTLEQEAIDLFTTITGHKVNRPGFVTNSKYPGAGYSPDGLGDAMTVEVKAFAEPRHEAITAKTVPLEILAQAHFGQLICEKDLTALLLYNPDLDAAQALKIIMIKGKRAIQANFKRILKRGSLCKVQ